MLPEVPLSSVGFSVWGRGRAGGVHTRSRLPLVGVGEGGGLLETHREDVKPSCLNPVFLGCLWLSDYVYSPDHLNGEDFLSV